MNLLKSVFSNLFRTNVNIYLIAYQHSATNPAEYWKAFKHLTSDEHKNVIYT